MLAAAPPPIATRRSLRPEWNEALAAAAAAEAADPLLGLCLYASRLLGADDELVLHGGGNTSVKSELPDAAGQPRQVLWVKGSGRDLAAIDARGFAPLELAPLRRLLELPALDDGTMMRELRRATLDPAAPAPSVETLVHAALPHRFVLHAHPDGLLAATSVPAATGVARRLFGGDFAIVPWVLPGFALARTVAELWRRRGRTPLRGVVLLHHGILTFADDAEQAWQALHDAATRAASGLPRPRPRPLAPGLPSWGTQEVATLRLELSRLAGVPLVVTLDASEEARHFAAHEAASDLVRRGPLTPDHVLRTKRTAALVPHPAAVHATLTRFAHDYQRYFRRFAGRRPLHMLDPAPRVVVAPGAGVFTAGRSAAEAAAAGDLYRHTIAAILAAEQLGGYRPLPARQVFEVEYWELEQAKLRARGAALPLAGRVAVVSGAAGGIGRAVVDELLAAGAAVTGLDLAPTSDQPDYLGLQLDVRDSAAVEAAVAATVRRFGGLDMVIGNVGVFPPGRSITELPLAEFRAVMEVNATSHLALLGAAVPLLERSPAAAAVVLVGSRNVLAPGPGAAAYSASKAALTQLARVAALELAPHGIRVNVLHPDGVFDTGIWRPEVLADRARRYGLTVPEYRRRNLLHREVRSRDVARLAVALCTDLFGCTTGAQIPVDGGDARVI